MSKLLWLPIDYPKLPDISSLLIPSILDENFAFWNFFRLTNLKKSPYEISDWKPWIKKAHPHLIYWFS